MSSTGLVIFIVATEISGLSVPSLQRAATEVLGTEAVVRVEMLPAKRDDNALRAAAPGADSVVELWWQDAAQQTIVLHCYLKDRGRWIDRQITFDPSDAEPERGRTLGFALGSMLVSGEATELGKPVPFPGTDPRVPPKAEHTDKLPANYSLDIAGLLATGVGGFANGGGASAGLEVRLAPVFWLRTSAGLRFGDIPPAQATSRDVTGTLGLVWRPLQRGAANSLTFGVAVDAGADWLSVSHLSADDPEPARESTLSLLANTLADLEYALADSTGVFLGVGGEFVFGKTEIYTKNQRVAVIPVLRAQGFLGIRTLF